MANAKHQRTGKPLEGNTNNGNKRTNSKQSKTGGRAKGQPRKDSSAKRVNYDNAREDKVAKRIMEDAKSGKFNDINDFLRNPGLLQSAASIPVFPILGESVTESGFTVPGIMVFLWEPNFGNYQAGGTFGTEMSNTLYTRAPIALNQASDSTYSFLVHANSRNYNYNAPDLFLLILAGSQVFSIIENLKRAYGIAKTYTETNRYYPDGVLSAMGFDPSDLRHNLGQAWFDINNLIMQTRQIWVPNTFPIVTRWMDINSNLYKDSEGMYAQTYVYTQHHYFEYDETEFEAGASLRKARYQNADGELVDFNTYPGANFSWSTWVAVAQHMIDMLINSEDRGIIYGDLLNAYTAEKIIAIPEINSDYTIMPEYSPEISMQIENTTLVDARLLGTCNGLVQYDNKLYPRYAHRAETGTFYVNLPINWIMNFHSTSDVTPEMILLATRFTTTGMRAATIPDHSINTPDDTTYSQRAAWVPASNGSEIVRSLHVGTWSGGKVSWTMQTMSDIRNVITSPNNVRQIMSTSAFDWGPIWLYLSQSLPQTSTIPTSEQCTNGALLGEQIVDAFGDWDKYALISADELRKINDVAFYSLYGVPQI